MDWDAVKKDMERLFKERSWGEMAESGEAGEGRMAVPLDIVAAVERRLGERPKPLSRAGRNGAK